MEVKIQLRLKLLMLSEIAVFLSIFSFAIIPFEIASKGTTVALTWFSIQVFYCIYKHMESSAIKIFDLVEQNYKNAKTSKNLLAKITYTIALPMVVIGIIVLVGDLFIMWSM